MPQEKLGRVVGVPTPSESSFRNFLLPLEDVVYNPVVDLFGKSSINRAPGYREGGPLNVLIGSFSGNLTEQFECRLIHVMGKLCIFACCR